MTPPEPRPSLLAALLHERFTEYGWFTRHYSEIESNDTRLDQLRRAHDLEAAVDDDDTTGVPDQNDEVA